MQNGVLWRKEARLVKKLAELKSIDCASALSIFFASKTHKLLLQPESGLQLMSDGYILEDLLAELKHRYEPSDSKAFDPLALGDCPFVDGR
ncbi:DUF3791 domain-containing protein [Fibrobacter sp.]|uniref:DUF3791 domain-containing protein n=1 Tax=Fibrobacter sp. TaxID=35828 RepID=UPI00389101C4